MSGSGPVGFEAAKQVRDGLEAEVATRSQALRALQPADKGPMGLAPDAVRFSPGYRAAKQALDGAFARLQAFNATFVRTYKAEIAAERDARRSQGAGAAEAQEQAAR